jgi:hypothetical protein
MPITPDDVNTGDKLEAFKLDVGEKRRMVVVDVSSFHMKDFDTEEPLYQADGKPKTGLIVRLRDPKATSAEDDLNWWTRNQVKVEFATAVNPLVKSDTYRGAVADIERLEDLEPKKKGYKGAQQWKVTFIEAGPVAWVDPLNTGPIYAEDEAPF